MVAPPPTWPGWLGGWGARGGSPLQGGWRGDAWQCRCDVTEALVVRRPLGAGLRQLLLRPADEVPPHRELLAERHAPQKEHAAGRERRQLEGVAAQTEVAELPRSHDGLADGHLPVQ